MPKVKDILQAIEAYAPLALQESYDNAGLQVGDVNQPATGALLCLDITEEIIDEAIQTKSNLILAHHPLAFKPFKSLTGKNYIERCMLKAIKSDLVIYAAHTNLDNAAGGINYLLAEKIGLQNVRILTPQQGLLLKDAEPFNLFPLMHSGETGAGIIGELPAPENEKAFLLRLKQLFRLPCLMHSAFTNREIRRVALCSGSGSFLANQAIAAGADIFITGEAKYNDFYDVEDKLLLAVVGHYESELFTKELFYTILLKKFPTFALHFSHVNSNPVKYL